jgi:hypothetical protein
MEKIELVEITGKKLLGLEKDEEGYFCMLFEGGYKLRFAGNVNGLEADLVKDGSVVKYAFDYTFYENEKNKS